MFYYFYRFLLSSCVSQLVYDYDYDDDANPRTNL